MSTTRGTQILTLTGLRFDANLGVLEHEKEAPQPIAVDVELNLGSQPLHPRDAAQIVQRIYVQSPAIRDVVYHGVAYASYYRATKTAV